MAVKSAFFQIYEYLELNDFVFVVVNIFDIHSLDFFQVLKFVVVERNLLPLKMIDIGYHVCRFLTSVLTFRDLYSLAIIIPGSFVLSFPIQMTNLCFPWRTL